jgi:hypothetical protein
MARDEALEAWLREALRAERNVSEKAMFGGHAWLLDGHLLCAARDDGMLARVGGERNAWALALPDVGPMIMRGRPLDGWVRATPDADAATRRALLDGALAFVRTLPAKQAKGPPRRVPR